MADRDIPGNGGPNRKASEPIGRTGDETRNSTIGSSAGSSTGTSSAGGSSAGGSSSGGSGNTMKRMGSDMADQAADLGRETMSGAQGRIRGLLEQQTDRAADQLGGVAAALHKAAESLSDENNRVAARYAGQAAERVEEVADMIRNSTLDDMLGQVEGFARRQPEMFIGGALALGFLAARFIKSSGEGHYQGVSRSDYRDQGYAPPVNRGRTSPVRSHGSDTGFDTPSRGMAGGIAESASRTATPRPATGTSGLGTGGLGTSGLGSGLGAAGGTTSGATGGTGTTTGLGKSGGTGLPSQNTATAATTAARTRDAADLISGVGTGGSGSGVSGSGPAAASAGKPAGTIPEETLGSSPASAAKPQGGTLGSATTTAGSSTANTGSGGGANKP